MRILAIATVLLAMACSRDPWECDFDLARQLEGRTEGKLTLRELTDFDWRTVEIFAEYQPAEKVRALGIDYQPDYDYVPEGAALLVFFNEDSPMCRHTWFWVGSPYGFGVREDFNSADPSLTRDLARTQ